MCEGICSNGHLYSLFYKIKSEIRSITCVSIVSVNISIGNGGERVYREQKDKVHMHAAVHTKTEGIREKNRVTDMRTHLQTHPHIKHETKQVCPTDRNKWGSKQKGKGTIGKTNRSTPIQTPWKERNEHREKRSGKEPLSTKCMHETCTTYTTTVDKLTNKVDEEERGRKDDKQDLDKQSAHIFSYREC